MALSITKFTDDLKVFVTNPIILSSFTSWFLSQLIKGIIVFFKIRKKRDFLEALLWRTGGMPSSHAAVVTSMTASVAFSRGLDSDLFAVSFLVALLFMRDAVGVRRAVGLQAKALNLLGSQTTEKNDIEFSPVKEIKGHAPLEVIAGALLGILISAAFVRL
ncbi:MAG: divergent PAP2 family protein [Treponema sp.]|jgi:acid phosphatase family membrane protein YuiD|nr:divergent PAP2 family protein [Treponema sp.]